MMVVMLYNKKIMKSTIISCFLMVFAEIVLFTVFGGFKMELFSVAVNRSYLYFAFYGGILILFVAYEYFNRKSRKEAYVIDRLKRSEFYVFLMEILAWMMNILLLYFVQVILLIVLGYLHCRILGNPLGIHGLVIESYRSDYLHSLFPMDEWILWIRNLVFLMALSMGNAYMGLVSRKGKHSFWASLLICISIVSFKSSMGSGIEMGLLEMVILIFVMIMAAGNAYMITNKKEDGNNED